MRPDMHVSLHSDLFKTVNASAVYETINAYRRAEGN